MCRDTGTYLHGYKHSTIELTEQLSENVAVGRLSSVEDVENVEENRRVNFYLPTPNGSRDIAGCIATA